MKVWLQLDATPGEAAQRGAELSRSDADGLFTFEGKHDVFLPLALAAHSGMALMTNVAIALPRSPLHLAHAAYDLHHMSSGNFTLGLGSQVRRHIEQRYGAAWSKPAARMAENVAATREILQSWQDGRSPSFDGRFTRHVFMPPMFDPGPNPYGRPPVLMGALGPVMTRTAGEVADGLLVMPFHSRRHLQERTLPAVVRGLENSGRTLAEFRIVPQVVVGLGANRHEWSTARRGVAELIAFYATTPAYVPVLEVHGWAELQPFLSGLASRGRIDEMVAALDAEKLDVLAVTGTPAECAEQIGDRFADLAHEVCCYFPGQQPRSELLQEFVARVHEVTPR